MMRVHPGRGYAICDCQDLGESEDGFLCSKFVIEGKTIISKFEHKGDRSLYSRERHDFETLYKAGYNARRLK